MAIEFIKNPEGRHDPKRPIIEHLIALRDMLVFAAIAWFICAVIAGIFTPEIVEWLRKPALPYLAAAGADGAAAESGKISIEGLDLSAGWDVIMTVSMWAGTALSFPFLSYALLRFVFPALTNREKSVVMAVLLLGTLLFTGGGALAYSHTLPLVVSVFDSINGWVGLPVETVRVEGYIGIVLKVIIAFGLVFQLPLVLIILGWLGMISSEWLKEKRKISIVLIFVLAMFLTPPDPLSQVVMAVPLCLLYEFSIWVVWMKERMR